VNSLIPRLRRFSARHLAAKALFRPLRAAVGLFYYTELHDCLERRSKSVERMHLAKAHEQFESYRDRFGNKRCFVIGNGPSLNEMDLPKLRNELTIGSNGLYLNFSRMGFYPTFYTVTNSLIAEQMGEHIAEIEDSIKVFPLFLLKYFDNVRGEVTFLKAIGGFVFSEEVTRWISWQSTVTFFNLQLAYSLGCPEVYLIGVDNSYRGGSKGQEGELVIQKDEDVDHFSPTYFDSGFRWHRANTERMARVYRIALASFTRSGRVIMNAGRGGNLEVFPRIEFEDLF
jgi:hypothetical protein